ncbi:MAG: hypothetical protein D6824_06410 [Planctomycetota bacterium]|nr:MAG: hypothetical protein D6824_06410 [Planctomycetota bacterium]
MAIVGKNASVAGVEVDLLCLSPDRRRVVVVEVKARRVGAGYQPPLESAVDARKLHRLRRAARAATAKLNAPADAWRIDVVTLQWSGNRCAQLRWLVDCAPR